MAATALEKAKASPDVLALPSSTKVRPQYWVREVDAELPARLWAHWIPNDGPRAIRRPLRADERVAIAARADAIKVGIVGFLASERVAVDRELSAMLGGFRSMRQQDDEVAAIVDNLLVVLREFPLWAIAQACLDIARGQAGLDRRFPPNDSQIYEVVEKIVRPYRKQLAEHQALLIAPVEEPEPPREQKPERRDLDHRMLAAAYRPEILAKREALRRPKPPDNKHAARVAADLAQRRQGREQHGG